MSTLIQDAFKAIGAEAIVETAGNAFEIDVRQNGNREVYQLKYPTGDTVLAEALDVKPKQRHLVLDVSGWRLPIGGRYLCGHDEQHWFVASLPFDIRTTTVRGAMEALPRRNPCGQITDESALVVTRIPFDDGQAAEWDSAVPKPTRSL